MSILSDMAAPCESRDCGQYLADGGRGELEPLGLWGPIGDRTEFEGKVLGWLGRMTMYPCPCCSGLVFDEPPGSYSICPICFWEDDQLQLAFPLMAGGANKLSLLQSQEEFLRIGASDPRLSVTFAYQLTQIGGIRNGICLTPQLFGTSRGIRRRTIVIGSWSRRMRAFTTGGSSIFWLGCKSTMSTQRDRRLSRASRLQQRLRGVLKFLIEDVRAEWSCSSPG